MQYAETLPLEDHEVVLSFDDGPLPHNSNKVLEILASECVKANFFLIGQMARTFPDGVRKLRDAGHTIGTHTQTHPLSMNRMPIERAKAEIDDGIASVKAALGGDAGAVAPFFRIPGLLRAEDVEDYLATQGIQTWSADFPADDWKHISSSRVYELAMQRIEAKGRGILLLHDIQARTVAALPRILHELKVRGYRIVHVVPATPDRPATPTEPQQWQLHPMSETVATSHWPKIPSFVFVRGFTSAGPALSDFNGPAVWWMPSAEPFEQAARRTHRMASQEAPWPQIRLSSGDTAVVLPVPAPTVFEIQEMPHPTARAVALLSPPPVRTALPERETSRSPVSVNAGDFRRTVRASGRSKRSNASRQARHSGPAAAGPARRGPLKHLVLAKKRSA